VIGNIILEGKNGVRVEVVQHSISESGKEIFTVNVKYGLLIHAELLRHRTLSRCVKSNRAIPMKIIRKEVLANPYSPVFIGKNQAGMVADSEMMFKGFWEGVYKAARYPMCAVHWFADKCGAHKEWANRLLNPWQYVSETITATEWDNLYNLRIHKDAQKDAYEVVKLIRNAQKISKPVELKAGEYHVPYVARKRVVGVLKYFDNDGSELSVGQAIKASAARCARSSYNNHDKSTASYKNDIGLFNNLIESEPKHASPVEHQATPMSSQWDHRDASEGCIYPDGITHQDTKGNYWSGNLKGWIQYRQLIPNNACWDYKD